MMYKSFKYIQYPPKGTQQIHSCPSSTKWEYRDKYIWMMQKKSNKVESEIYVIEYAITMTEPYSPWQNRADGAIRELKRRMQRKMHACHVPRPLWDYCFRWSCDVHAKTAHACYKLDGQTPFEVIMGTTPDITSLIHFDFYEPIWFYDEMSTFPKLKRAI